jgi:hypothetical protein
MVVPVAAVMIVPALIEAHALVAGASRRALLAGAALIALAGWAAAAAAPAYSETHQQRFTIEYVSALTSGRTSWSVLNDGAPLPKGYGGASHWRRTKLPFSERMRWLTAAPRTANVAGPRLETIESVVNGSERALRLRLHTNGAARILLVFPEQAHLSAAGMDGFVRPIGGSGSAGKFTVACTGRSCDGANFRLDLSSHPQPVIVVGARDGLPNFAAPLVSARPPFARPQYTPDETLTLQTIKL